MGSFVPTYDARRRNNVVYEPFSVYGGNSDHLNKYRTEFSSLTSPYAPSHSTTTSSSSIMLDDAAIEWKETPEAHIFKTLLPGVRREDVKVQVENDQVLKISGERVTETADRHSNWNHVELSSGKFFTAMRLPEDARVDLIKSSFENGVLTVVIPRRVVRHHPRIRNVELSY